MFGLCSAVSNDNWNYSDFFKEDLFIAFRRSPEIGSLDQLWSPMWPWGAAAVFTLGHS